MKIASLNLIKKIRINKQTKETIKEISLLGFKYIEIADNYTILTFSANGVKLFYYIEMPDGAYKINEDYELERVED